MPRRARRRGHGDGCESASSTASCSQLADLRPSPAALLNQTRLRVCKRLPATLPPSTESTHGRVPVRQRGLATHHRELARALRVRQDHSLMIQSAVDVGYSAPVLVPALSGRTAADPAAARRGPEDRGCLGSNRTSSLSSCTWSRSWVDAVLSVDPFFASTGSQRSLLRSAHCRSQDQPRLVGILPVY